MWMTRKLTEVSKVRVEFQSINILGAPGTAATITGDTLLVTTNIIYPVIALDGVDIIAARGTRKERIRVERANLRIGLEALIDQEVGEGRDSRKGGGCKNGQKLHIGLCKAEGHCSV